jgi:hypothetical protein
MARIPHRWLRYGYGIVLHEHRYDKVPLSIFRLVGGEESGGGRRWEGGVEMSGEDCE